MPVADQSIHWSVNYISFKKKRSIASKCASYPMTCYPKDSGLLWVRNLSTTNSNIGRSFSAQ